MVSVSILARMIFILLAFLWTVSVDAADRGKHQGSNRAKHYSVNKGKAQISKKVMNKSRGLASEKSKVSTSRRPSSTPNFASERLKLRAIAGDKSVPKSFSVSKKKSYNPRVRSQTEDVNAPVSMRRNYMYN